MGHPALTIEKPTRWPQFYAGFTVKTMQIILTFVGCLGCKYAALSPCRDVVIDFPYLRLFKLVAQNAGSRIQARGLRSLISLTTWEWIFLIKKSTMHRKNSARYKLKIAV